jgi:hypothetical protein
MRTSRKKEQKSERKKNEKDSHLLVISWRSHSSQNDEGGKGTNANIKITLRAIPVALRASSGKTARRSPAAGAEDDEEDEEEDAAADNHRKVQAAQRVRCASSCARVKIHVKSSPWAAADDQDDHTRKEAPCDHGKGSTKVNITQPRNIQHSYSPEEDGEVVEGDTVEAHTDKSKKTQQPKMRQRNNGRMSSITSRKKKQKSDRKSPRA